MFILELVFWTTVAESTSEDSSWITAVTVVGLMVKWIINDTITDRNLSEKIRKVQLKTKLLEMFRGNSSYTYRSEAFENSFRMNFFHSV